MRVHGRSCDPSRSAVIAPASREEHLGEARECLAGRKHMSCQCMLVETAIANQLEESRAEEVQEPEAQGSSCQQDC